MRPPYEKLVRPADAAEDIRLMNARRHGPFIAWRDAAGTLQIHQLGPGESVTAGRSTDHPVAFDHPLVSRDHVSLRVRVRGERADTTVDLLDIRSKHGTVVGPVKLQTTSETLPVELKAVPVEPSPAVPLAPGDHDIGLAGTVWLRVGGVPVDLGLTREREDGLPAPKRRQREILVELCRWRFEGRSASATPSNGQIAASFRPVIGTAHVSDLLSEMYIAYGLSGTNQQRRAELVELAVQHGLVGPADYR